MQNLTQEQQDLYYSMQARCIFLEAENHMLNQKIKDMKQKMEDFDISTEAFFDISTEESFDE